MPIIRGSIIKKDLDTYVIVSALVHSERQNSLVRTGIKAAFFYNVTYALRITLISCKRISHSQMIKALRPTCIFGFRWLMLFLLLLLQCTNIGCSDFPDGS